MNPNNNSAVFRGLCFPRVMVIAAATGVLLLASTTVQAQDSAEQLLDHEVGIVSAARAAAKRDDHASVDAQLREGPRPNDSTPQSVLMARRAAGVCGWLYSEGEYGRAMEVARRTLRQLHGVGELSDTERVERLYWEAFLEGEILDRKGRALALLLEAEKLAPDDDRISEASQKWATAIAEFGDNSAAEALP